MARKRNLFCYLMVAPALILVTALGLYPMLASIRMSFLQYDLMLIPTQGTPFVGFQNYATVFAMPDFLQALINTVAFVVVAVGSVVILGLLVAQVLSREFKGRGTVRTLVLISWFIPPVVAAGIWNWMFQPDRSPINLILRFLGLITSDIHFLTDSAWVLGPLSIPFFAIALVRVWNGLPFTVTFIMAGLQSISKEIYEAAEMDGANGVQRFWFVTLPMLQPVLSILITLLAIGGIGAFDLNYILTGGGPRGLTNILAVMSYNQAFSQYRFDLAATIANIILLMTGVIGFFYVRQQIKERSA
jgi:multiple sugar transport system permease protein